MQKLLTGYDKLVVFYQAVQDKYGIGLIIDYNSQYHVAQSLSMENITGSLSKLSANISNLATIDAFKICPLPGNIYNIARGEVILNIERVNGYKELLHRISANLESNVNCIVLGTPENDTAVNFIVLKITEDDNNVNK